MDTYTLLVWVLGTFLIFHGDDLVKAIGRRRCDGCSCRKDTKE